MAVAVQTLAETPALRVATAQPTAFKPGQVLEAVVLGKTPEGLTALKIGDLVVNAQLPQALPAGTTLQLQVKIAGTTPQLTLLAPPVIPAVPVANIAAPALPLAKANVVLAQAPVPTSSPPPTAAPLVAGSTVAVPPSITPTISAVSVSPAASLPAVPAQTVQPALAVSIPTPTGKPTAPAATAATPVTTPTAALPQSVVAGTVVPAPGQPTSVPELASATPATAPPAPAAPTPASAATVPPAIPATASLAPAAISQNPVLPEPVSQPSVQQAATPQPQRAGAPAPPVAQTSVGSAGTATAPAVPALLQPVTASSMTAPNGGVALAVQPQSPQPQAPQPQAPALSQAPTASLPATTPLTEPPAVVATALAPAAGQAPNPATTLPPPAPMLAANAALQPLPIAVTVGQGSPQASPPNAPGAVAIPTTLVRADEQAASPLLVAQGAPRPQATLADLPKALPTPTTAQPGPPPLPTTPQAALAQMVPDALAKQNSLAPLLMSLATMVARQGALPEPVLRAAMQVLAQRIALPAGGLTGDALKAAMAKSGIYLEAGLSTATPPAGDLKAGLTALRGALATWLGGSPTPVAPDKQAAPPLKGMPLRGDVIETATLPDAPREAGRVLHSQADAALSRVKLMQLASLPDTGPQRASAPEQRMELPFLIGNELVMAQLQVTRDGPRQKNEAKRGWTMRFAMSFSGTGEVGAEIGILGKAVNVSIWAAEPDTAERLNAALPELGNTLRALGLDPGGVRVRGAPQESPKPGSGHLLDSLR